MEAPYKPLSCSLYDYLTDRAVVRKTVAIRFLENNQPKDVTAVIKDIVARNKEEFLLLDNAQEIRLDRLLQVDGKEFTGGSCAV